MANHILALSGPRACGKSTIAKHLVNHHGYTRIAFSDALRQIASCSGQAYINDRTYLARLGTTLREMWPTFLLEVAQHRIERIEGPVVLEDLRFPTEVEFAAMMGATTIRFEISKDEQLRRLTARDGKQGADAHELLNCMDEHLLDDIESWVRVCKAEGDFLELAATLDAVARKRIQSRAYVNKSRRPETMEES
jgi:cytidylate kinase